MKMNKNIGIDRETSGVLIIIKDKATNKYNYIYNTAIDIKILR